MKPRMARPRRVNGVGAAQADCRCRNPWHPQRTASRQREMTWCST
jgi:hypothetical protein